MPKVVIDTSVWIDFFRETKRASAVEQLIRADRAVTCGIVRAELIAGIRSERERRLLQQGLAGIDYLETNESTWRRAGELAAELRTRGHTLPMSDLIVAAIAIENDCLVYTKDSHFRRIPGVKLYKST